MAETTQELERRVTELRKTLDVLWSELPVDIVMRLAKDEPEIVDLCRDNHDAVSHSDQ